MNKAVAYVRVSSKEQEREGFSIPAQKKFLSEYAINKNLKIIKVFEESESAKTVGRKQFKAMLDFLKSNPDVHHILVEKTDRLYRNLKDYSELDPQTRPHLNIHLAKEYSIISADSKTDQKFVHGMNVLMSKRYIDNLSEEVKKGMGHKAYEGHWPSRPPIGYTSGRDRRIEPDPKTAPILKRGFELAASGNYSLSKLKRKLFNEGLLSARAQAEFSKSQMQRVLTNPIYYGDFVWKNQYYKGKHTPLISKELFDTVQTKLGVSKKSKLTKKNFSFTSTMTCGTCGCAITAEEKNKKSGLRYVYYHCTSGKGDCPDVTYIEERKIESWLSDILIQIQLPAEIIEWTKLAIQETHSKEIEYQALQRQTLEKRYRTIQNKINKVYEDKLEGQIDLEFWSQQNNRLQQELATIESQIAQLRTIKESNMNQGIQLMELAKQAPTLFQHMTTDEKRELVNLVLSNPRIENGSLRYDLKKPFSMFANVTDLENWRS